MSDIDLAKHIARDLRAKVDELNALLAEANKADLVVDLREEDIYAMRGVPLKHLTVTVSLIV